MSVTDREDDTDLLALNLKRAPSAGTVINDDDNNTWERSQSDANLSRHKQNLALEKPHVSDNARVYLDLFLGEQVKGSDVSSMNTTATSGFPRTLDTIPQHDEILDSSRESLSSDISGSSPTHHTNLEAFSGNKLHQQIQSSTHNSATFSLDAFAYHSLNSSKQRRLDESDLRKSCSALPPDFRRSAGGIAANTGAPRSDISHQSVATDGFSYPKKSLDAFSSNYFCESDFDDSREKIPNYQSKLKSFQDAMTGLINKLWENQTTDFEWPNEDSISNKIAILSSCKGMLDQAWLMPNVGRDCATALCDLIRQQGLLNYLAVCMTHAEEVVPNEGISVMSQPPKDNRRQFVLTASQLFNQILTSDNLDSILGLSSGNSTPKKTGSHESLDYAASCKCQRLFKDVVKQSWIVRTDKELNREFIAILEAMLKHHEKTNRIVVQSGGLKTLIYSCRSTDNATLRRVAIALVNLGLFGDSDVQMIMAHYKVADWLFPLAFNNDDIIKYYACLAIVVLAAHKELNQIIQSSGTIELVFSFIKTHSPYHFAGSEPSHFQGRSAKWLKRLLPLLNSESVEAVTLASFHFVMEARIKLGQGKTQIFQDIGAIEVLRRSASSTHKIAAQFSRQALKILGMQPPFTLCHPVPIWTVEDVSNWLRHIGFEGLSSKFRSLNIDGDLLLTINPTIMERDLGLKNGIIRLRLAREINRLKKTTTYETCDPSGVCDWLKTQVGPEYCKYTYALIQAGVDRKFLVDITDEMLEMDCFITNSVHRTRILNAIEEMRNTTDGTTACKIRFQKESQYSVTSTTSPSRLHRPTSSTDRATPLSPAPNYLLSNHADDTTFTGDIEKVPKNIDIFISYRRNNGAQLASLIMVHLKLRGYRVFLDIERLPAGKFNDNLLQSIQRSKNFLIVLTENSLERCCQDVDRKDWIHREVVCAMDSRCNIIPVTDKFTFPDKSQLPEDMSAIVSYNAVAWVHDYQEACIDKIEQFIKNSEYRSPFSPPQLRMSSSGRRRSSSPDMIDDLLYC